MSKKTYILSNGKDLATNMSPLDSSIATFFSPVCKKPYNLSKEPYVLSKPPYILSKEPYILPNGMYVATNV